MSKQSKKNLEAFLKKNHITPTGTEQELSYENILEAIERIRENNRKLVSDFEDHAQSEIDFAVVLSALKFLKGLKIDPPGVKNFVVLFLDYNARIIVNPQNLEEYRKLPNAVVNPDLSRVQGVPPHLWRLSRSKNIMPITGRQAQEREANIRKHGIDKFIPPELPKKKSGLACRLLSLFRK